MSDLAELEELVVYLVRSTRLTAGEAHRIVDEVLNFLDETADEYVRRRHLALQHEGLGNAVIFARLASELQRRRFRCPPVSERQIRRMIYG